MDNQYKYLRRLSNQSQPNQNEEEIATNRTEILKPTKTIERVNIKNLYLQDYYQIIALLQQVFLLLMKPCPLLLTI